ncbi:hypothetical protein LNKW23_18000 [Paralimibaculum aggregatum]|uniref:Head-tail adaptor protein n=1 Tax=Paralimibaculum aggregatum TaxID=3036245 RepID=A0ABQ6LHX1_9RHOB|nr:phage head closure protein [Limibaculum sp. NKW23]GMG82587.1 hypothetical protein LNKW23_18000 [Limibaculum sp. NKW23]
MPRAGRFRERARFQRRSDDGRDAHGQALGVWGDLVTVWAHFRETLGKEGIEAGRLEGNATGTLRIRYSAAATGITSADRVVIRGAVWNIRGQPIQIDNRNRVIEMKLERGVAVGADLTRAFSPAFSSAFG